MMPTDLYTVYHCITVSLITTSLPLVMTEPYVHTYILHTYLLTYIHTFIDSIHTYIHTAAYCTESRQAAVETSSEPQQPQSVIDPLEVRGGLRVIDE